MNRFQNSKLRPWESYQKYLLLLANLSIPMRLQAKLDATDVVQQTLLAAHRGQHRFRGSTPSEQMAWLRKILAHQVAHEIRRFTADKRNVDLERSLNDAFDASSDRLEKWVSSNGVQPHHRAESDEELLRLAAALEKLPAAQRQAVEMKHLQGCNTETISQRMERSQHSVAGLLRRGLRTLRARLRKDHQKA